MKQFHLPKFRLPGRKKKTNNPPLWGRVKTAWIAILLVCNVLLLIVLICVNSYDLYLSHRTRTHMDAMLAERGILCGSSVYRVLESCPTVYTMHADSAVQEALAQALLTGTVTSRAEKGNTMVWTGENGSVSWAASGNLEAHVGLYSEPQPTTPEQAQAMLRRVLAKAGIDVPEAWMQTEVFSEGSANSSFTITIQQELEGIQLLGCGLTAELAPGNELTLTGVWCTGEPERMNVRALETYSAENALFQLLDSQVVISQIQNAQPAYVLSDKSGGRFTTIPCWRFSTESGDYVLNILTGDVVASADIEVGGADSEQPTDLDDRYNDDGNVDEDVNETDTDEEALPDSTEDTQDTNTDNNGDLDIQWNEQQ